MPKKIDWARDARQAKVRVKGAIPVTDELPRAGSPREGSRADKLPDEVIPRAEYDQRYGTGPVRPATDATRAKLRARPEALRLKLQHYLSRINASDWSSRTEQQKIGQVEMVKGTVGKLLRLDPSAASDPWVLRAQSFLAAWEPPR